MKIVLTGGGTGGHFYPIIAVAEKIRQTSKELRLLEPKMYYMAPHSYDEKALFDNDIIFKRNSAGKRRTYRSFWNFIDLFKTAWGILTAMWTIFFIFPDVVFAKGGYVSFPVLVAARFFGIPVIIHESDSVPGRVNRWAGKFAKKIAVSFPEAIKYFPVEKTAHVGNPIRDELISPSESGAKEYLKLESGTPVIFIIGGSQGAQRINEVILSALPELVKKYQIIHQTGVKNIDYVKGTAGVILKNSEFATRYKPFGYLDILAMKMSAGIADLVISRSGSSLFEIASWGVPSILVPIPKSISRDQRSNAFSYSSTGAAVVIEEKNFTPNLLLSEIDRILSNPSISNGMSQSAKNFAKNDASIKIADAILKLGLKHEE